MITLIEALHFRCLHYVSQPLGSFHVLVGPNASGKTTFLDVVAFLGCLVSEGLDAALAQRTENFHDLLWNRSGDRFEVAVEVAIPGERRQLLAGGHAQADFDTVRYEVGVAINDDSGEVGIDSESVLLKTASPVPARQLEMFPSPDHPPTTLLSPRSGQASRTVVRKVQGGNDNFYLEVHPKPGKGWFPSIKLGARKSALGNLPEDETRFPVSTWLRRFLAEGVRQFVLNSLLIRKASPPGQGHHLKPDGSNLPWVVADLEKKAPGRCRDWIAHVRTALPDLENIRIVEREDDRHRYLVLDYHGGLKVPSWMASDGTLRLLALTLPAYLPDLEGVYLVEEPENGIHPRAVETMFQSLSSVYGAQVLLATHSPVILSTVDAGRVLCFAKTEAGATDIVLGKDHPALSDWRGETNLGVLFAAGVLS